MKKSVISILALVAFALLPASCTLFDDDYLSDSASTVEEPVPVHTGQGYDRIETIEEPNATVDYQLQSNVCQMAPEYERYINRVRMDSLNQIGYIEFLPTIPDDIRPRKGEILLTTPTTLFPEGLGHMICKTGYNSKGLYVCFLAPAAIQQIYKHLKVDVDMMAYTKNEDGTPGAIPPGESTRGTKEYDVSEGWKNVFNINWTDILAFLPQAVANKGSKNKTWNVEGTAKLGVEGDTKIEAFMRIDLGSWYSPNIEVSIYQKTTFDVTLSGNAHISGKIWSCPDLIKKIAKKSCTFIAGPVVLKFFIPLTLSFDANFTGTGTFHYMNETFNRSTINEEEVEKDDNRFTGKDLKKTISNRDSSGDIKYDNDDGSLKGALSGSVGLTFTPEFCMGFYTKALAAKLAFPIDAVLQIDQNPTTVWKDGFDISVTDVSGSAGITCDPGIGVQFTIVLDLNVNKMFQELLGDLKDAVELAQTALDGVIDEAFADVSEYDEEFRKRVKDARESIDNATEKMDKDGRGSWLSFSKSIPSSGPKKFLSLSTFVGEEGVTWPWYPNVDDTSFKVLRENNDGDPAPLFSVQYTPSKNGALRASDEKPFYCYLWVGTGDKQVGLYSSTNKRKVTSDVSTTPAKFLVTGLEPDVYYTMIPFFMPYDITFTDPNIAKLYESEDVYITKEHKYIFHQPKLEIVKFTHKETTGIEEEDFIHGGTVMVYKFDFTSTTKLDTKGKSIAAWGVDFQNFRELESWNTNQESSKSSYYYSGTSTRNGEYKQHWILYSEQSLIDVELKPWLTIASGKLDHTVDIEYPTHTFTINAFDFTSRQQAPAATNNSTVTEEDHRMARQLLENRAKGKGGYILMKKDE